MCNECVINNLTPVAGCECGCNETTENKND